MGKTKSPNKEVKPIIIYLYIHNIRLFKLYNRKLLVEYLLDFSEKKWKRIHTYSSNTGY